MVQLFLWTAALFAMACMPAVLSLNFLSGLRPTSIPTLKKQILDLSRSVDRGLTETPADREKMADLFQQLERLSSRNATLKVDALSAVWSLEYTTSDSILGRGGVPKVGPILQTIDARRLKAENAEVRQYFGLFKLPVKVTADLTPWTPSKVCVCVYIYVCVCVCVYICVREGTVLFASSHTPFSFLPI
jgi:hypothetical protein